MFKHDYKVTDNTARVFHWEIFYHGDNTCFIVVRDWETDTRIRTGRGYWNGDLRGYESALQTEYNAVRVY